MLRFILYTYGVDKKMVEPFRLHRIDDIDAVSYKYCTILAIPVINTVKNAKPDIATPKNALSHSLISFSSSLLA